MSGSRQGKRHAERQRAVQVLYGLTFSEPDKATDMEQAFALSSGEDAEQDATGQDGYARDLVSGVWDNLATLDESIGRFSLHWRVDRLGRIELTLLRVALYELMWKKTPARVVISEALVLAKEFDVDDASQLIHGILDAAARETSGGKGQTELP